MNLYTAGVINQNQFGCLVNEIILYISLTIVLGVVLTRFLLAVWFSYFISIQLGKLKKNKRVAESSHGSVKHSSLKSLGGSPIREENPEPVMMEGGLVSRFGSQHPVSSILPTNPYESEYTEELFTVMLVTCYSEGRESLKSTLDSLANT